MQADGLVRANENFMAWLRGEKTMPFGPNGEHVPVRLVDSDRPGQQPADVVTNQWTYQAGAVEKRFDVVFLVNGLPLVIGEAKTPTRSAVTWFDGAFQINEIYEKQVPAMFVPNVFSFATEGKTASATAPSACPSTCGGRGATRTTRTKASCTTSRRRSQSMLRPEVVLDILQNFTLFATDKKHRRIKIICRYQQYETTNQIVDRVVKGYPKKGLIWHFQGSGKSLLMVFAAQKLRLHPQLRQPHGDDRGGPHRPRHADHRHLQRRRCAQHGRRGHAAGVADAARRRTCARCSSPPSTSSARPAAS